MVDADERYDGDGVLSQTVCERCVKAHQKRGSGCQKATAPRAVGRESRRWRAAEVGVLLLIVVPATGRTARLLQVQDVWTQIAYSSIPDRQESV